MRGDSLIVAKGYGLADREAGTLATAHTIYAIGSISKQFTAAAIMKPSGANTGADATSRITI
jgi:CubicO group peptidase (beta-lactamase class C family)